MIMVSVLLWICGSVDYPFAAFAAFAGVRVRFGAVAFAFAFVTGGFRRLVFGFAGGSGLSSASGMRRSSIGMSSVRDIRHKVSAVTSLMMPFSTRDT